MLIIGPVELRHIRYFVAAAEEEHFGRAASRLHISQPALSQQIKDLEDDLGVQLFDRSPRGVTLSSAGQTFLRGARHLLAEVNALSQQTRRASMGETGFLRIALNEFAMSHEIVANAFSTFRKTYPDVELDIVPMVSQKQVEAIRAGEINAGFLYHRPQPSPEFGYHPVSVDEYVLVMPKTHRLARRRRLWLRDLRDEPFISLRRSSVPHFFSELFKACAIGGLTPTLFQEVENHATILDLVAAGMGIAFEIVCEPAKLPKAVVLKKVADFSMKNTLDLVWAATDPSPPLMRFRDVLSSMEVAGSANALANPAKKKRSARR